MLMKRIYQQCEIKNPRCLKQAGIEIIAMY